MSFVHARYQVKSIPASLPVVGMIRIVDQSVIAEHVSITQMFSRAFSSRGISHYCICTLRIVESPGHFSRWETERRGKRRILCIYNNTKKASVEIDVIEQNF